MSVPVTATHLMIYVAAGLGAGTIVALIALALHGFKVLGALS